MKRYMAAALLLLIASCSNTKEYVITKSQDCVYEPNSFTIIEIPKQKLDLTTCQSASFGSPADFAFAKTLPGELLDETKKFIDSKTKSETRIYAAREIGDFILIFVGESQVADGGFEFVYSKKLKKVVGTFCVAIRG